MGGRGSTRWRKHQKRQTVDNAFRLSILQLVGGLIPQRVFVERTSWRNNLVWADERTGRDQATLRCEVVWPGDQPSFRLSYTVTNPDRPPVSVSYQVDTQTTKSGFGGLRRWFTCPNIGCGRRIGTLYLPAGAQYFACRHCHQLRYSSAQTAHKFDRAGGQVGVLIRGLECRERISRLQEEWEVARGRRKGQLEAQLRKANRNYKASGVMELLAKVNSA